MQRQTHSDPLSLTFAALADPTRREILARLVGGARTVKQLSEPFELSQPAISKHLQVLERAGLVERGVRAQWRPVAIDAQPLKDASTWLEDYRRFWDQSFERLDAYIKELRFEPADDLPSMPRNRRRDRPR